MVSRAFCWSRRLFHTHCDTCMVCRNATSKTQAPCQQLHTAIYTLLTAVEGAFIYASRTSIAVMWVTSVLCCMRHSSRHLASSTTLTVHSACQLFSCMLHRHGRYYTTNDQLLFGAKRPHIPLNCTLYRDEFIVRAEVHWDHVMRFMNFTTNR